MAVNVAFSGNATRDAELRFTASGVAVASFGVAVNDRVKEGDKWVDGEPTFYDVTAWRQLAEDAAGITKGTRLTVLGSLKSRSYETKDGAKRTSFEVTAEDIGRSILFESRGER